jgi:hypothetical protein
MGNAAIIQLATSLLNLFFQACNMAGMTEEEKRTLFLEEEIKFDSRDPETLPTE